MNMFTREWVFYCLVVFLFVSSGGFAQSSFFSTNKSVVNSDITVSVSSIEEVLPPSSTKEIAVTLAYTGQVFADWSVEIIPDTTKPFLSPQKSFTFGERLKRFDIRALTQTPHNYGFSFANDFIWFVSKDVSQNFHLYKVTPDFTAITDIPLSGNSWQTLCYSGEYLYLHNGLELLEFDPLSLQFTGVSIPAPVSSDSVRGLAYDAADDVFWLMQNQNAIADKKLYSIDRNGTIKSISPLSVSAPCGIEWENFSEGGPWLWINTVSGNGVQQIRQFNPRNGSFTNLMIEGENSAIYSQGLAISPFYSLYPGETVIAKMGVYLDIIDFDIDSPAGVTNETFGRLFPTQTADINIRLFADTVSDTTRATFKVYGSDGTRIDVPIVVVTDSSQSLPLVEVDQSLVSASLAYNERTTKLLKAYNNSNRPIDFEIQFVDTSLLKSGVGYRDLIHYTFDERGEDSTENFAFPSSPVGQFASLEGNTRLASQGAFGSGLTGKDGSLRETYLETGWVLDLPVDYKV